MNRIFEVSPLLWSHWRLMLGFMIMNLKARDGATKRLVEAQKFGGMLLFRIAAVFVAASWLQRMSTLSG